MWLQATLTVEDVASRLAQLTPVRIALDENEEERALWLARPSDVSFVPNEGVRIVTRARLRWDVVGIPLPVTIDRMTLLLMPRVEQQNEHDVLSFGVRIEDADLALLPQLIENSAIARVNAALEKPEAALVWRFMDTLDFHFALPSSVAPLSSLRLFSRWGTVRISHEALLLAVAFELSGSFDRPAPPAPDGFVDATPEGLPEASPLRGGEA